MRKIVILGSILSGFLLLMMPSINAIEYQNQKNIITSEKETIDYPYFVKIVKPISKGELRAILKNIIQILGKVLHIILAAVFLLFSIVLHIIKATLYLSFSTVLHIIKGALFLLFSVEIIIIIPFILWAISSLLP